MKISKYVSIIIIDENCIIIFNATTRVFHVLKDSSVVNEKDLLLLAETNDKIKEQFIQSGVLIDDNTDEVLSLIKRIENEINDDCLFQLHINPTLDCNFRCWYCYENHICDSKISPQTMDYIIKFIKNTLINKTQLKEFHLGFFGGEPLLYFGSGLEELIEITNEFCIKRNIKLRVQFTSNGFLLNHEIIDFLSKYKVEFQITLDGDKDHHDKTRFCKGGFGSFDTIVSNIISLLKHQIGVTVRINYTTQNAGSLTNILNYFNKCSNAEKSHLLFDFHRVWQQREKKEDKTDEIVSETKQAFKNKGFMVSSFVYSDASYTCYGDKTNYVLINYNGEAFGCTARDFVSENRIGVLQPDGTILYDEPVYSERAKAKFKNSVCHECRIAPICGGGCRQRAYESLGAGNRCVYNYDEEDKDAKILDIFYHSFC